MRDLSTTTELYVLLLDHIIGDPKKGQLAGKRPNPEGRPHHQGSRQRAEEDARDQGRPVPHARVDRVLPDGTLPDPEGDKVEHYNWVWLEGVPIEIPLFEGERVILSRAP